MAQPAPPFPSPPQDGGATADSGQQPAPPFYPQSGAYGMDGLFAPLALGAPQSMAAQQRELGARQRAQPHVGELAVLEQWRETHLDALQQQGGRGAAGGSGSGRGRGRGRGAAASAGFGAGMNALVSVANGAELRAQPTSAADFVYGGNCPGLQLLSHFDGTAEADSAEAFLSQINPVKTMVINKLAKLECANPKRWNESQKVLYPCREHSALRLRVKLGPAGQRVESAVEIVCCFSTNCKRSYWKLRSSARNWMCYFDNTELSEQCRLKCMCSPQRCSSCDETKCAGTDAFGQKPLLKQLEWLWDRNKDNAAMADLSAHDRAQAIAITERLLQRLKGGGAEPERGPAAQAVGLAQQAHAHLSAHASLYGPTDGGMGGMAGLGGMMQAAPAPCFVMPTQPQAHPAARELGGGCVGASLFAGAQPAAPAMTPAGGPGCGPMTQLALAGGLVREQQPAPGAGGGSAGLRDPAQGDEDGGSKRPRLSSRG